MISPYIAEFVGTAILLLLGSGIVANVSLSKTKGFDQTPLITITTAWGFAVFIAAYITGQFSGAHLNPAVTIGLLVAGKFSSELALGYIIAQILGAMLGSWLTYIFYIDHYRATKNEAAVMGSFCTSPAIRNFKNNFFSEFLATFILIFGILNVMLIIFPGWKSPFANTFGYLAIRSFLSLPISFPSTTGCKEPTLVGKLVENF